MKVDDQVDEMGVYGNLKLRIFLNVNYGVLILGFAEFYREI